MSLKPKYLTSLSGQMRTNKGKNEPTSKNTTNGKPALKNTDTNTTINKKKIKKYVGKKVTHIK